MCNSETGDASDQYERARVAHDEGEWEEAAARYERAAEQGHARAQFKLGMMYFRDEVEGFDSASACEQAVAWCEEAAANGLDCAKAFLGRDIAAGIQAYRRRNDWDAEREFRRLAAQHDAEAEFRLAQMYLEHRVPCDFDVDVFKNACRFLREASRHGYASAEYRLYSILAGEYTFADYTVDPVDHVDEAQAQYRKAATRSPECQYLLGLRAEGGLDHADNEEAVFWYRLAADRAHVDAQFRLGLLGLCGVPGCGIDEGAQWLHTAARNDHSAANALARDGTGDDVLRGDPDDSADDGTHLHADVTPQPPSNIAFGNFAAEMQDASELCRDEPRLLVRLYRSYRRATRTANVAWAKNFSSDGEI